MGRLFQGAATVDSILRGDLIERAAEAGLRSIFVGFETLTPENLRRSNKRQNLGRDYKAVADRLHSLGIMINGSFVFGMDDDGEDVFRRTVDWAVEHGITTATFHIQTPYPGHAAARAHGARRPNADARLESLRHAARGLPPGKAQARSSRRWDTIGRIASFTAGASIARGLAAPRHAEAPGASIYSMPPAGRNSSRSGT